MSRRSRAEGRLPLTTADAACKAAGVTDPVVLDACVFDYTQTGGPSFVASAARADRAIRAGVPLAVGREITSGAM